MLIMNTNEVLNALVVGWENGYFPTRRYWTGKGAIDTTYDALSIICDIEKEDAKVWWRDVKGQPSTTQYNGDSELYEKPVNEELLRESLTKIQVGDGIAFMDHDRCDPYVEFIAIKIKDDCWVYNNRHRFYNK